jgi:hypothetical protein
LDAFEFPKRGRITRSMSSRYPGLALAKVLTFAVSDAVQFRSRTAQRPCTWGIVPAAPGGRLTFRFLKHGVHVVDFGRTGLILSDPAWPAQRATLRSPGNANATRAGDGGKVGCAMST